MRNIPPNITLPYIKTFKPYIPFFIYYYIYLITLIIAYTK